MAFEDRARLGCRQRQMTPSSWSSAKPLPAEFGFKVVELCAGDELDHNVDILRRWYRRGGGVGDPQLDGGRADEHDLRKEFVQRCRYELEVSRAGV
jgi:hypothetical protein